MANPDRPLPETTATPASLLPNPEFRLALRPRWADVAALNAVFDELTEARAEHGPMASQHEALAVIREEYVEYEAEVFRKHRDRPRLQHELIQLAAMAVRALADLEHDAFLNGHLNQEEK